MNRFRTTTQRHTSRCPGCHDAAIRAAILARATGSTEATCKDEGGPLGVPHQATVVADERGAIDLEVVA